MHGMTRTLWVQGILALAVLGVAVVAYAKAPRGEGLTSSEKVMVVGGSANACRCTLRIEPDD